jgi:hypothetical protein
MTRALFCGICLVAIQASTVAAQIPPSAADYPIPAGPAAIDARAKPANSIPEIIRQPELSDQPKAVSAPAALLTPPAIDSRFLRATRLDQDQAGISR